MLSPGVSSVREDGLLPREGQPEVNNRVTFPQPVISITYSPGDPFPFPKNYVLSPQEPYIPPPLPLLRWYLILILSHLRSHSFVPRYVPHVHEEYMLIFCFLSFSCLLVFRQRDQLRPQKDKGRIITPPLHKFIGWKWQPKVVKMIPVDSSTLQPHDVVFHPPFAPHSGHCWMQ